MQEKCINFVQYFFFFCNYYIFTKYIIYKCIIICLYIHRNNVMIGYKRKSEINMINNVSILLNE